MADAMETNTIKVDDATFGGVMGSAKPVLVDFTAKWCAPCRVIEPVLEEIADEYRDQLTVARLDVDENPQTALTYSVMSMPTLILFLDGAERKRLVGARPKHVLVDELSDVLTSRDAALDDPPRIVQTMPDGPCSLRNPGAGARRA